MDHPCKISVKYPQMFTKCLLNSFSPWLWAPLVIVVSQDGRGDMFLGVPGYWGHLRSLLSFASLFLRLLLHWLRLFLLQSCNMQLKLWLSTTIYFHYFLHSITFFTPDPFGPGYRIQHCNEHFPFLLVWLQQGFPAVVVFIICNSKHRLQQFKGISITIYPINMCELQDSLSHHGLHHGLKGSFCSDSLSCSSLSFKWYDLSDCSPAPG